MRWMFTLFLTLLAPAAAWAAGCCSPEGALLELEERHKTAFVTHQLERSVDFHAEGRVVLDSVELQETEVRVYEGGTAIVTGLWAVQGTVDGQRVDTPRRFTHVWIRGDAGWTLMSSDIVATRD